jgi:molybdopterin/thiamine biosynthesis adenylyltransferase
VLVLGTGGLNSNTIPHLCGLGVGRLTLVDRDVVEPRNFARQYLYRQRDLGRRKVRVAAEWVRAFDPTIDVNAVDSSVDGTEALAELLDRTAPDVVMSGIDRPAAVDAWVNAGCVAAGVPFVRAGMWVTQGTVWSVDPGVSACRECARRPTSARSAGDTPAADAPDDRTAAERLQGDRPLSNRGIGPVAGLLGAYAAFEVLRYLTGFEPPAYAGSPLVIDFAAGCSTAQVRWQRRSDCPVCGDASGPPKGGDRHEAQDPSDRERTPDLTAV